MRVGQMKMTTPTLAERQEHERTHIAYRSWCRHCVAARASNPGHRGRKFAKAVEDDKDMKQVSYDHCFMRDQLRAESATVLLSKDSHGVGPRDALAGSRSGWAIQRRGRDLDRLGH